MKRALLQDMHRAAHTRPAGYLEACLQAGHPSADGKWIEWTDEAHAALRQRYNPARAALQASQAAARAKWRARQPILTPHDEWLAAVRRRPCGGRRAP